MVLNDHDSTAKAARRSSRQPGYEKTKLKMQREHAKYYCEKGYDQSGLEERFVNFDVGRGVFATQMFKKGDFLLQYVGKNITVREGKELEKAYFKERRMVYLYIFKHDSRMYCIDATEETKRLGRLVNDGDGVHEPVNCAMKVLPRESRNQSPVICLFATRDIFPDEELRYDYGNPLLPWRKAVATRKEGPYAPIRLLYVNPVVCNL
ncbi:N-lysine methyltransferase KMT5A-like [Amphiura filiformis]|uniref:N-lysine methyltransferase KMT5A-like n=1 Tax=Amphiura filiformis TaxID=82378 RepID=UPI003B21C5B9